MFGADWYRVPGVDEEPTIENLRTWTILTQGSKSIILGRRGDGSWRKSSYICKIEGKGDDLKITTYSGRIYNLREQDKEGGTPLEIVRGNLRQK